MSFFVIILYIKAILVQGIFFDTYSISLFGYSFGILFWLSYYSWGFNNLP